MVSLVETIAKSLVEKPDEVVVRQAGEKDGAIIIELKVAPEDMGKVIGRQGRIAKALRTVVKAASQKQNLKVTVEIIS
ncbi:MAG: KH domain-containing protein [Firmicutes bacterium]|nr:KH domain-containing protein [Bacillota bacterium]